MANTNTDAARAAFVAAGLNEAQVEKALAGLASLRDVAGIEVVVNSAEERKFGDVSIFKVQGNGYRKPAMGLFQAQIQPLIESLTDALAVLTPKS